MSCEAAEDLELRNDYNVTGYWSENVDLVWEPVPNSTLVLVNDYADEIEIWNVTKGSMVGIVYIQRLIRDMDCSPDGRYLAVSGQWNESRFQTLAVYDLETWEDVYSGNSTPNTWSSSGAWSPDGTRFALGSMDGDVFVYDTSTWSHLFTINIPSQPEVSYLEFSSDKRFLAANTDVGMDVINLTSRAIDFSIDSEFHSWMPDSHVFLYGLYHIADGDRNWETIKDVDSVFGRFHPSGSYLAVGGTRTLCIYHTDDWSRHCIGQVYGSEILDLRWAMNGDLLYTLGDGNLLRCWIVLDGVLDDKSPTVDIAFPKEGHVFEDRVYAIGSASDDRSLQYVFVRIDESPWQLANGTDAWKWVDYADHVGSGPHGIQVRAFDGKRYSRTVVRNFTVTQLPVENLPPELVLISPRELESVQDMLRVILSAEDESPTLEYELGIDEGTMATFVEGTVWERSFNVTNVSTGTHVLWVWAHDGELWSAKVNVTIRVVRPPPVDRRPVVSIHSPINHELLFDDITISGSAWDDNDVDFVVLEVDGEVLTLIEDGWNWSFEWNSSSAGNGYHNLTAWAWDGVQRSQNATVLIYVREPSTYFTSVRFIIVRPLPGEQLSGEVEVVFDVVSEPPGYEPLRVWMQVDNLSVLSEAIDERMSIDLDTRLLSDGSHRLRLRVTGYGVESPFTEMMLSVLNTDTGTNEPPSVTVESPLPGDTVRGTIVFWGRASDDHGLLEVEIRIDDGEWIAIGDASEWSYTWDSGNVSDGEHTLEARAFDGRHRSGVVKVAFVVDNYEQEGGDVVDLTPVYIILLVILSALLINIYFIRRRHGG